MKKIIVPIFFIALILAASCGSGKLYEYQNYNSLSYAQITNPTERTTEDLINLYKDLIEKPYGERKVVPPGICADYGYLLIRKGEVEKGIKLLKMEVQLYPESSTFIAAIIKRFEK